MIGIGRCIVSMVMKCMYYMLLFSDSDVIMIRSLCVVLGRVEILCVSVNFVNDVMIEMVMEVSISMRLYCGVSMCCFGVKECYRRLIEF